MLRLVDRAPLDRLKLAEWLLRGLPDHAFERWQLDQLSFLCCETWVSYVVRQNTPSSTMWGFAPSAFAREQVSDHRQYDVRPFLLIETIGVHVDDVAARHDGQPPRRHVARISLR